MITAVPLKSGVTSDTKGSDLAADVDPNVTYSLAMTNPQADIAESVYSWLMLSSDNGDEVTSGGQDGTDQTTLALTYLPAGPPSKVLNLAAQPGDASAIVSWGIPESNGGPTILDGYDVEVIADAGTIVREVSTADAAISLGGLTNDVSHTIKVRSTTRFGKSGWESTTVTPKMVPPLPPSDALCNPNVDTRAPAKVAKSSAPTPGYAEAVSAYYQAQDAVLEGRASDVWADPSGAPDTPIAARLSLLNQSLVEEKERLDSRDTRRANSTVTLHDIAIQSSQDGEVRVTAGVERKWEEVAKSDSLADQSDSRESYYITVTSFNRCGDVTREQVLVEAEKDSTDFSDNGPPGGSPCCAEGSVTIGACESDTTVEKGLLLRACYRSAWIVHDYTGGLDKWIISRMQATAKLVVVGNSSTVKKKWKYLLNHSILTAQSAGCAESVGWSPSFGWGIPSVGLSGSDSCAEDEFKGAKGQLDVPYEDEELVIECRSFCLNIKGYKHKARAKAEIAYSSKNHVLKSNRLESNWYSYSGARRWL